MMSQNVPKFVGGFSRWLKAVLFIFGLAYPFLIYFGLDYFSPLVIGISFILILSLRMLILKRRQNLELVAIAFALSSVIILLPINDHLAIKVYPVAISLAFGSVFLWSLFHPPSIIERLARLREPNLPQQAVTYTRNVTKIWVGFFLFNTIISGWTVLNEDMEIWTLYNGFLSYLIIGCLFLGEFIIRSYLKKRYKLEK
ncbi:hypothetical protein [Curvivirga sp.]|uniref:COG4648 family protein n=1 Tax=Curvivirga sp. TaxID=2856848 RepID=UPI003B5CEB78